MVTGATGRQGGHVARALLVLGHKVHALVRDPSSASAFALQRLGIVIFRGDFSDYPSIHAAALGTTGVFLNVYPVFTDPDGELKHAQNIISACRDAGVKRIVYSSASHVYHQAELTTKAHLKLDSFLGQYFWSKYRIQEAVKEAGLENWTILQPAWLMSNLLPPSAQHYFPEMKNDHILKTAFREESKLQLLDPQDVGKLAAEALADGNERWNGKVVPLASEELTMGEIADVIDKGIGGNKKITVTAKFMDDEERERVGALNPMVFAQIWLAEHGFDIDLEQVRSYGMAMGTLQQFVKRERAALEEALGA